MGFKKFIYGLLGTFLLWNTAKTDIRGFVHDSYDEVSGKNCPVKIYRKPKGSKDTLFTTTDENGRYLEFESNFILPASPGDTLFVHAYKDTLGKTYTSDLMFLAGTNYNLEITLNDPDKLSKAFTVSLGAPFSQGWIQDTSGLPNPINGIYWLAKNPEQKCTTQVDTGYVWPLNHYWRSCFNFEEQDSVARHDDSVYISLEKTVSDTTWRTLIPFTIDTTWLDAMKVADTMWFPLEKIINDQTQPSISDVTTWPDTNFTGPYPVSAYITDASGIDTTKTRLSWKLNNSDSTIVRADSIKSDTFYFTVLADSSASAGDSVNYKIKATDASNNSNKAYWPGPNPDN